MQTHLWINITYSRWMYVAFTNIWCLAPALVSTHVSFAADFDKLIFELAICRHLMLGTCPCKHPRNSCCTIDRLTFELEFDKLTFELVLHTVHMDVCFLCQHLMLSICACRHPSNSGCKIWQTHLWIRIWQTHLWISIAYCTRMHVAFANIWCLAFTFIGIHTTLVTELLELVLGTDGSYNQLSCL